MLERRSAPAEVAEPLLARYWTPAPQFGLGLALRGKASAALDISDGLLADCGHIARASGVALLVECQRLQASAALSGLLAGEEALRQQLAAGDDYVLAFTLPPAYLGEIRAAWPAMAVIGRVEAGQGCTCSTPTERNSYRPWPATNISEPNVTEHPDQAPAQPVPPSVWRNPWHFLAFGFGSGTLPKAPGTWGSLVAIPFIPLWQMLPDWGYWLMLGVTMLFGFWLCGKVADDLRVHDHEGIVWDEMVGMWITLWLVPEGWWWLLIGFVVFRIVDILKPWPISWVDRNVHGGVGIMLDDVLAGVFAWLVMQGLVWGWVHWLV